MKELDALIEALEKKGIIRALNLTLAILPPPNDEAKFEAIKGCLAESFDRDDELMTLFTEFTYEIGMQMLIKTLDIKPEKAEKKLVNIIEAFLKNQ